MVGDREKIVRKAPATQAFWGLWKESKDALKAAGYAVNKFRGQWEVAHWSNGEAIPTVIPTVAAEPAFIAYPELTYPSGLKLFQVELVKQGKRCMDSFGCNLVGHGTGVGKTFISLAISRERGRRVAVICPKNIIRDWHQAAKLLGVELVGVFGWEYVKTGKTEFGEFSYRVTRKKIKDEWTLVNTPDKFSFDLPDDVDLIFDEAHRARNYGTQNSKLLYAAKEQKIPHMLLSATIGTDPVQMDAIGHSIGLHRGYKDYYAFMKENGCYKTRFGFQFSGTSKNLQKLNRMIFPQLGQRVRPSDLGDAFPETTIEAKTFSIEDASSIADAYSNLQTELERIEEQLSKSEAQSHILAAITRARQRVELLKAPSLVPIFRDAIEEGNSVFVTVNFKETLEFLRTQMKNSAFIVGGQTPTARQAAIDSFQSNEVRCLIGINLACQEGISLHDLDGNFPRIAYHMPTSHTLAMKQVFGRVARIGGKSKSFQYVCYCEGVDVEESVCLTMQTKLNNLSNLMDGESDPVAKFYNTQQ